MNLYIRLLRIALKDLAMRTTSASFKQIVEREIKKTVRGVKPPTFADVKKNLTSNLNTEISLKRFFATLDTSSIDLLKDLLKEPEKINKKLQKALGDAVKQKTLNETIDELDPPEDGSSTALIAVSSS